MGSKVHNTSLECCPQQAPGIVGQMVANELVLVIPGRGEVKVLNPTGALIWHMADGAHSVRQMAVRLSTDFAVPQEQAEQDVLAFVGDMLGRALLVPG